MADATTSSMLQGTGNPMLAPMLTAAPNTIGTSVAQFPTTPATTPGAQTIQAQQQQFSPADILMQQHIALAAAISSSANANIQLNAGMQAAEHPHSLAAAAPIMISGASAHSRSTSIVDGAVAMYPRDGSNSAATHNGISAGGNPNSLAGTQPQQPKKAHDMATGHDIKMPPG
ncbi:hypothetical protein IWW36_006219, partial [Coemansia brasiliensis]